MITQDKILELWELLAKGTQGKWDDFSKYPEFASVRVFAKSHYIGTIGNSDDTKEQTEANATVIVAIHNAAPELLDSAEEAIRLREGNIAMLGALEVVKREVECYCTHEGINAGKNGYPCAHCMAVAVLTRADKRGWGTLVADNALLKETMQLRKELERLRELVKVVSKELHEFVNNAHGNEDPCHCGMCDRARAALALASKEVA